jgi:hypothetical protein
LSAARAFATTADNGYTILSERDAESSAITADCVSTTDSLPRRVESLAGSFLVIDINVHANPIFDVANRIPERLRSSKKPAVFSICSQYAELVLLRVTHLNSFRPIPARRCLVLRMQEDKMGVP